MHAFRTGVIVGVMAVWFGFAGALLVNAEGTGSTATNGGPGSTATNNGSNTAPSNQSGSNGQTIRFDNPTPYNTIMELLRAVLDAIVRIMMPVIAIMFIVTGFMFVTAGGDEKKLETAKKMFFGTVVGAAIILGAWALATAIASTIQQL